MSFYMGMGAFQGAPHKPCRPDCFFRDEPEHFLFFLTMGWARPPWVLAALILGVLVTEGIGKNAVAPVPYLPLQPDHMV